MKFSLGKQQRKELLGKRECVHVPIVVASSIINLFPGEKVCFVSSEEVTIFECSDADTPDGIVDPFYKEATKYAGIPPNTPVAILLFPGKVENIHHEFTIKDLDNKKE